MKAGELGLVSVRLGQVNDEGQTGLAGVANNAEGVFSVGLNDAKEEGDAHEDGGH